MTAPAVRMADGYQAEVTRLRAALEESQEELRSLRQLLATPVRLSADWRLTRTEQKILGVLNKRAALATTAAAIHLLVHGQKDGVFGDGSIKSQVCKMRKKLRPHGIEIETVGWDGYRLTDQSRKLLAGLLAERLEAAT